MQLHNKRTARRPAPSLPGGALATAGRLPHNGIRGGASEAPRRATMSVASGDLGDVTGGHVKIGAAHHYGRNTAWAIAAVVMLLGVIVYTAYSNRQDTAKLTQL